MKIAIMQPYLFPYIGYFQLINAVDYFGIGDNVQFINKGWINRNRKLVDGNPFMFVFSLKNNSHKKVIKERFYGDNFEYDKSKVLKCISYNYRKAPYFEETYKIVKLIFDYKESNVSLFNEYQLQIICNYLKIKTPFISSSLWEIDDSLNGNTEEKTIKKLNKLRKSLGTDHFINPIGGSQLYTKENFIKNEIKLNFLESETIYYKQFDQKFVPNLSIIDVMMFNSIEQIGIMLNKYELK